MKNPNNLHYGFNIKQPELFPVPTEDVNAELENDSRYQGDDVCEYL